MVIVDLCQPGELEAALAHWSPAAIVGLRQVIGTVARYLVIGGDGQILGAHESLRSAQRKAGVIPEAGRAAA